MSAETQAPPPPATPAAKTVKPGTARFHEGMLVFDGAEHSELLPAKNKAVDAYKKAVEKLNTTEGAREYEALRKSLHADDLEMLDHHLGRGELAGLKQTHPTAAGKMEALLDKHARAELNMARAAENKVTSLHHELQALQAASINNTDIKTIAGYADNAEHAQNSVNAFHTQVKARGMFGIMHTEGVLAALDHNIGPAAFKANKTRAFAHVTGVGVGGFMLGDAFLRSNKSGPDGQPTERSWVSRVAEAAVGAGIAGYSALHGRRP